MNKQKDLWESLAKKNSKYYINSDYGKGISDLDFRRSGAFDTDLYIIHDELISLQGKILEIGCGTGRMTEFIAQSFEEVVGVDISGEMIRQGKERLKDISNVKLIETDGSTFPLEDNYFDTAFSYIVFQHIKTKEMVESNFKEVYRVLKAWGLFKVLLRADRPDNMDAWWNGVDYDDDKIADLCKMTGFRLIKTERVKSYGIWVWMEK